MFALRRGIGTWASVAPAVSSGTSSSLPSSSLFPSFSSTVSQDSDETKDSSSSTPLIKEKTDRRSRLDGLRAEFQEFFKGHGHTVLASSSLVPTRDPSLLFINAGMAPLKGVFTGEISPPVHSSASPAAVSIQRCLRAGGKHNDLDNVGFTARHQTLFEMAGNFSWGAYGKAEAISYAWKFLTENLGLPQSRLSVTYFSEDEDTAKLWQSVVGLPPARIRPCGAEDNFWSMGDGPGPCGPCTEIFWDMDPDGSLGLNDDARYLEIWNLVFMQYDRGVDGSLTPLPRLCIDTGAGIERLLSVMEGVGTNFETSALAPITAAVRALVPGGDAGIEAAVGKHVKWLAASADPGIDASRIPERVIADHVRASVALISDGVYPSNTGRGYVLRRIVRRAVRYGSLLGINEPFLSSLVPAVASVDGVDDGVNGRTIDVAGVGNALAGEEALFFSTLDRGMGLLNSAIESHHGKVKELNPETVFQLYDTYGFPLDLTELMAREHGLSVDMNAVNALMEEQRAAGRAAREAEDAKRALGLGSGQQHSEGGWGRVWPSTSFTGYHGLVEEEVEVLHVLAPEKGGDDLGSVSSVLVAIDPCPFYATSGGQVGDRGVLIVNGVELTVEESLHPPDAPTTTVLRVAPPSRREAGGGLEALLDLIEGKATSVVARVDPEWRSASAVHHTATHLLHAALRAVLGPGVGQAGSLVEPERLRFDFSAPSGLSQRQIEDVEAWVNAVALSGIEVATHEMDREEAIGSGAMAFFGEKYGDSVRVVSIDGASKELCGGTHVENTRAVYPFKILSESSIATGTRRVEAVAGAGAVKWMNECVSALNESSRMLGVGLLDVPEKVRTTLAGVREKTKRVDELRNALAGAEARAKAEHALRGSAAGHPVAIHVVESSFGDHEDKKVIQAELKARGEALAAADPEHVHVVTDGEFVVTSIAPKTLTEAHAGKLMQKLVAEVGGRGGGPVNVGQGRFTCDRRGAVERLKAWIGH